MSFEADNFTAPSPQCSFQPVHMLQDDINDLRALIVGKLINEHLFDLALTKASQTGVPVDCLLLQEGLINEADYFRLLAQSVGAEYLDFHQAHKLQFTFQDRDFINKRFEWLTIQTDDGIAVCPLSHGLNGGMGPVKISQRLKEIASARRQQSPSLQPEKIYICSFRLIRETYISRFSSSLLQNATDFLAKQKPEISAKGGLSAFQTLGLLLLTALAVYGFLNSPEYTTVIVSSFFAVFFFCLIGLRLITALSFGSVARLPFGTSAPLPRNHPHLPVYTILVPLFREVSVLKQLTSAIEDLDYPKSKLDVKLLLEEVDTETISAVRELNLPPYFHIIIVPDGKPRTKPKALNYGLQLAQGSYIVIYDAEDIPDPDQLRRALLAFENNTPDTAVIQAKLNFYNPRNNWLTKQFTIEYSSLFDGLLPAYFKFGIPLPLGGTSNHFRRDILEAVGAWDPYNVTEDADLGMRLYRNGFRASMLSSTTYEEACSEFSNWFCQRTRWLKGWMQTYYVHMRQPFQLWRDLGTKRFLGFQAIIGAPIFSALVHPIFLALLILTMPFDKLPSSIGQGSIWGLSLFNLGFGYFATMWLGMRALGFRQLRGFGFNILTIPIYWLLISFATYRAVFQLIYAPFLWEKTAHKGQEKNKH